jgi:protocatechuate 3,4-dioxygenase beta subunit
MKISSLATLAILMIIGPLVLSACTTEQPVTTVEPPIELTSAPSQFTPSQPEPAIQTSQPPEVGEDQIPSPGMAFECIPPAELTPSMTEGPYYTADTPLNSNLFEPGMSGTKLILSGYVVDLNCQPIADVFLDFWQADAEGVYDNSGYRLRGHQFSDENGFYKLETVLPGEYPGRTPHIHFKAQPPNGQMLTSQLFFPGAAGNTSDRIFDTRLLVSMEETPQGFEAFFLMVLPNN